MQLPGPNLITSMAQETILRSLSFALAEEHRHIPLTAKIRITGRILGALCGDPDPAIVPDPPDDIDELHSTPITRLLATIELLLNEHAEASIEDRAVLWLRLHDDTDDVRRAREEQPPTPAPDHGRKLVEIGRQYLKPSDESKWGSLTFGEQRDVITFMTAVQEQTNTDNANRDRIADFAQWIANPNTPSEERTQAVYDDIAEGQRRAGTLDTRRDRIHNAISDGLTAENRFVPLMGRLRLAERALAAADNRAPDPNIIRVPDHIANEEGDFLAYAAKTINDVYRERAQLLAALTISAPAFITDPDTDNADNAGYHLLVMSLPTGQCTWHIHPNDLPLFDHLERRTPDDPDAWWDGHTTAQKYDRLAKWINNHFTTTTKDATA